MNELASIDLNALVRGVLIGLGSGLIVTVIANKLAPISRGNQIMLGAGIALVVGALLFYMWPTLIDVPDLGNLSQAEAEDMVRSKRLTPEPRPQRSETQVGRVIPYSQEPSAGLRVRGGAVVRFAVSQGFAEVQDTTSRRASPDFTISMFRPRSAEKAKCVRYPDRVFRVNVNGTFSGLPQDVELLLWVRPVNPPSETPGWYLQRPPSNGITRIALDGTWKGLVQLGNAQWPPHEGDIFDVAVTVTASKTAHQLLSEIDVVIRDEPVGLKSFFASNVLVTLK